MKNRIIAILALSVLVLNLGGSTFADTKLKAANKANAAQLVALLPATDGVLTMDVKRFFGEALPKLLSGNQPLLAKVVAGIDEMKSKTGIDVRQFETIAAGVTMTKIGPKNYKTDPIMLARGQVNANALIGAAKLGSNGKYREDRVGSRTIYIFQAKEVAKQAKPKTANSKAAKAAEKAIDKVASEMAVTAYDSNTIAFGSPALVRATVEGQSKVSPEITTLLARREISIINFAGRAPEGMGEFLPLDSDELGKNINSIRFVFGSIDVVGESASLHMTAKTLENAQAQGLFETLEGLRMIGKAVLGSSKTADKQVFSRMVENVKFAANGNEVSMDLAVLQGDIDILVGMIK